VPDEYEPSSFEVEALQVGIKTQNGDFYENGFNDFDDISVIYGDHFFKQNNMYDFVRKITVRIRGAQTQNIDFVETGFTDRTDFIIVRYSVTNNGLPISFAKVM
jgi:hypothetical protein